MTKDDCLLLGWNQHVVTMGSRNHCARCVKELCRDGEYKVQGPGIDLQLIRINGKVYPNGGSVDGNLMPSKSPAEWAAFFGTPSDVKD